MSVNRFQKSIKSSNKGTPIPKNNNFVNEEKKANDPGTVGKLKEFCGYTTAHGLGRLVESKGYVRRFFWVLACLGAFAMFISQVVSLANQYASKPVETYITMKYVRDIDFPVITICNHNVIRRSKVFTNVSAILQEHLRNLLNNSIEDENSNDPSLSTLKQRVKRQVLRNVSRETNQTTNVKPTRIIRPSVAHASFSAPFPSTATPSSSTTSKTRSKKKRAKKTTERLTEKEKKKKNQETKEDEEPLTDFVTRQKRIHAALASWPQEELVKLGHQFKDMFRECTYRGKSCMHKKFWDTFWHYKYGNCYSFNKHQGLMAGGPGPAFGLVLEMNVQQDEYIGDLTKDAGIRVHIENNGNVPFPYEKGFSVGPGSATSVGIRKVKIKRADPFKNGSCMGKDGKDGKDSNLFLVKHNASYSTTACRESCLSDKQKEWCGCREYRFPKDASKKESVCDIFNVTVEKCLARLMKKYRKSNLGCSRRCPSPCNENVYKLTVSTSRFPSLAYERILLVDKKKLLRRNIPPNDLSSYLLQLNVFFEELNYEIIEERLGYGLPNFISDIGGNVGMWIGVSVLTIAEILELLCVIIHHVIENCTQRRSKIQVVK